jgi:hypothetical protein
VFRELFTGLAFPVPTVAQDYLAVSWLQVSAVRAVLYIAGLAVVFCEVWYLLVIKMGNRRIGSLFGLNANCA